MHTYNMLGQVVRHRWLGHTGKGNNLQTVASICLLLQACCCCQVIQNYGLHNSVLTVFVEQMITAKCDVIWLHADMCLGFYKNVF
jgi:hypothetical protein